MRKRSTTQIALELFLCKSVVIGSLKDSVFCDSHEFDSIFDSSTRR